MDTPTSYQFTVSSQRAGKRVDRFLSQHIDNISRSRIKQLIEQSCVQKNGELLKEGSYLVKTGDHIEITIPPAEPTNMLPTPMDLDIVFEDRHLLVLNKPAGLTVHPGAGNYQDTLANALLHHCGDQLSGIGGVERPGIVHRLDKDTSGLMMVAKSDVAHQGLSKQIAARDVKRHYLAVCFGTPVVRVGTIDAPIGRHRHVRTKMAVTERGGKTAITHYDVKELWMGGAFSLIHCRLQTGRTHQIRVHLTHLAHSLIGDQTYGGSHRKSLKACPEALRILVETFPRQALHAFYLEFAHPVSGEVMRFETPLPEDIEGLLEGIRTWHTKQQS